MGKILPIDGAIGITEEEMQEGLAQLRAKMLIDARQVWNKLVGLAGYALDERVQLDAQKTVLAYTFGLPTEKVEVKQTGGGSGPRKLPALEEVSDDELKALKTIRDAQRRRALTSGEDDE